LRLPSVSRRPCARLRTRNPQCNYAADVISLSIIYHLRFTDIIAYICNASRGVRVPSRPFPRLMLSDIPEKYSDGSTSTGSSLDQFGLRSAHVLSFQISCSCIWESRKLASRSMRMSSARIPPLYGAHTFQSFFWTLRLYLTVTGSLDGGHLCGYQRGTPRFRSGKLSARSSLHERQR
jgi:hypothetical protein